MFLVFAGAGASKAVDPAHYPSTIEFFERLPDSIKTPMFHLVLKMLRAHRGTSNVIDIEQVLWALGELRTFLRDVTDERTVPGWLLKDARLLQPVSLTADFGNLLGNAPRLLDLVASLMDGINLQIYDWYAHQPSHAQLEQNWLTLLRPLLSMSERVELFTTNYDLVLEIAADELAREGLPEIRTGRTGAIQRVLDQAEWLRPPRDPELADLPGGLLTKLHGSVDYGRAPDGTIYVGDPFFKGSHERHAIVYPGFKGVPDREPFNLFHNHLARAVAQSARLLFVGFAFRDEYINSLLERYTQPRAAIVVINPAEQLPQLPYAAERVRHIRGNFDPKHIGEALNDLGVSLAA
jgi:hypothetical protein